MQLTSDESKFAQQLLDLGFEKRNPYERKTPITMRVEIDGEPEVSSMPVRGEMNVTLPCFTTFTGRMELTIATDETGQHWVKQGEAIDLTQLGFTPMFTWHPVN